MGAKELLESWTGRIRKLDRKIVISLYGSEGFSSEYTGIANRLGSSTVYNSPLCCTQIELAMVMSEHLLVDAILQDSSIKPENFNAEPLRQAQILKDLKIIDLGCGLPTFARTARKLGGDVYTVDLEPVEICDYLPEYFSEEDRKLEIEKHIQVDLRNSGALEAIIQRSGRNFDLVTEAHLETDGFYGGRTIAHGLLRKGGIHFAPVSYTQPEIYVKE